MYINIRETGSFRVPPPPTGGQEEVWTIDESEERYPTFGLASLAAAGLVMAYKKSIVIYLNGEPYDVKRF